ncbi:MAG: hypothetical protein H0T84_07895 [Tatlockia sp.]|nr:hypothetical protein [Tatlockia sp.]
MRIQLLNNLTLLLTLGFSINSYAACDELKITKGLPLMVDSKTELHDVLFKDMSVTYTYQLKNMSIKEAKELRQVHKNFIEKNACNDENIQCLFKKDLSVKFVYKMGEKKILRVYLSKNFCEKLMKKGFTARKYRHARTQKSHL